MRVTGRELTLWSFLMSTAHGAGLMVAPVLIGLARARPPGAHDHEHADGLGRSARSAARARGCALHVAAMLAVMGVVALSSTSSVGLQVLRRAWLNTDQAWAARSCWLGW